MEGVKRGSKPDFVLSYDGILRFGIRLCVPNDGDLRRKLIHAPSVPLIENMYKSYDLILA